MNDGYYTLAHSGVCEIIINKSRFIAEACSITSENEALKRLDSIRTKYPDANHHCYAYVLGSDNIKRFNDDGEPGGTAGMPILQVLEQQEIQDALVVVTRYFGGIKLGAGGLVRAYSKSAALAVSKAEKVWLTLCPKGSLFFDYSFLGTMEHFLRQNDTTIIDVQYEDKVKMTVVTHMDWEDFCRRAADICSGKLQCRLLGYDYYRMGSHKT